VGPERRSEVSSSDPQIPISDEERFRSIFQTRYSFVHSYVLRRLGSRSGEISDVTAQVFHVAWRRRSYIPDPPNDLPWLYGVARKLVYRHWRTMRRRRQLEDRLTSEARAAGDSISSDVTPDVIRVRAAIGRLRPADQELLKLTHWEQLSRAEAGKVLGCSANAVSVRLHKAQQRLRRQLDRELPHREEPPGNARRSTPEGPSCGS
jgi:RNA polymerase sigma-70 factor (ECF subfamily)